MVKQTQTVNPRRWSTRTLGLIGLPVVIAVLLSAALIQTWTTDTDDLEFARAEQRGVAYLQPLTDMLDRLVDAQSATVEGGVADSVALREGMRAVDEAEREHGQALGSGQRWADLRNRVNGLINQRPTGDVAYRAYTDVVQLMMDLVSKIADSSNLVLDPVLDSYYLMDAAVLRLPEVALFAGRASDLGRLAPAGDDPEPRMRSETRIGVARYQVSLQSDGIAAGLRKAMDVTSSSTLGPNITNELDTFRTAVDAFVPPMTLLQNLDSVDATTLALNAGEVRQSARKLVVAILNELDKLLQARIDGLSSDRTQTAGLGLLAVLIIAATLWVGVFNQRDRKLGFRLARAADDKAAAGRPGGAGTRSGSVAGPNDEAERDPGEARVSEELVHVGRGIRARRRERADDSR